MPDLRLVAFCSLVVVVTATTVYSVLHNTYLDTSDPLLTHLPHPLAHARYFADKANYLNIYFIKKAWGWTSLVFLLSWITSPPSIRTAERVWKWVAHTAMWLIFTTWFFGPSLFERVILLSGGECLLTLPSGDLVVVPEEHCFTKSFLSPQSHPHLFAAATAIAPTWTGTPRLRRGHDISGHIFLLIMSTLFLVDQLRYSLHVERRPLLHTIAMISNIALIGIWLLATYTTSLYFHSPVEKVTGFLLGVSCFVITLLPEVERAEKLKKKEKLRQMQIKQSKD
ncbi:putative inositol phospholipid synthesis and fat-storage-inducing TM [Lyophyllum shimeji]|uniref:Inositol phospholipid synthesis and fat-storage-inducing TM n=1 Tax=Lyophyllum shimeji TaxID=47721 RepID=A0A9P3PKG6_LYOSH|nr:putative inositol phospholipid synthesis and fat-storage-inducing TM [Lyophyllum shimeji]